METTFYEAGKVTIGPVKHRDTHDALVIEIEENGTKHEVMIFSETNKHLSIVLKDENAPEMKPLFGTPSDAEDNEDVKEELEVEPEIKD